MNTLKSTISIFAKDSLMEKGFEFVEWNILQKKCCDNLVQSIHFDKGTGRFKGKFTVDFCYRFTFFDDNPSAFSVSKNVGHLTSDTAVWFPLNKNDFDNSWETVTKLIQNDGFDYLDSRNTLNKLVDLYEARPTHLIKYFGDSLVFSCFNLAFSYKQIGELEKSKQILNRAIDQVKAKYKPIYENAIEAASKEFDTKIIIE